MSSNTSLVAAVLRAGSVLLREGRPVLARHGLSEAQFNLLATVGEAPRGLSQRDISDRLVVDSSNITGLVDRMQKQGLVRRAADPSDRRRHRILATPEGLRLLELAGKDYDEAVRWVEQALRQGERRLMADLLRRLEERAVAGGRSGRFAGGKAS